MGFTQDYTPGGGIWQPNKATTATTTTKSTYVDKYGNTLIGIKAGDTIYEDPDTDELVNVTTGQVLRKGKTKTSTSTDTSSSKNSGGGGGGGGGGGSSYAPTATIRGWFLYYAGFVPDIANNESTKNWTEQEVINWALKNGKQDSTGLNILRETIQRVAAPFYDGDPGAIPASLVDSLIAKGYWTSDGQDYLQNQYFPALVGVDATNPLVADFIDTWVEMTGRPMGSTALSKMNNIIKAYGFTDVALDAWIAWVKTTDSAWTGNYGAEQRYKIESTISSVLGRHATEAELAPTSTLRNLNEYAMLEAIKASPEYQAIYAGKPASWSESDWIDYGLGMDQVFHWYYGDHVTVNSDGSFTFPTGPYYTEPAETSVGVEAVPTPGASTTTEPPAWKSLSTSTFKSDLQGLGFTVTGEGSDPGAWTYKLNGEVVPYSQLATKLSTLAPDTYYQDTQGFHYVQYEGAVNPKTGLAATVTKPATTTAYSTTTTSPGGLQNFGVTYVNNDLLADMAAKNYTPEMIQREFQWIEDAAYQQGVYGDTVAEAFGGSAGIDWYTVASGAQGSGAMRAKIVEAQNRVSYRETYRQIFGTDPDPSDYDRITQQFVSPGEMLREHQAIESADEMYEEVNDLLMRVYGQGVSKDELKDMVLGRPNSGELKALINQATKLDSYRWIHKQYYGADPTPDDYAKYAGYSGSSELQWEIVTHEKVNEMRETVNDAMYKAGYDPFTDEELFTLYGEQEGYGDLASLYRKAAKKADEVETAEDWQYNGAEQADIGYTKAEQGGFKISVPGIADL